MKLIRPVVLAGHLPGWHPDYRWPRVMLSLRVQFRRREFTVRLGWR